MNNRKGNTGRSMTKSNTAKEIRMNSSQASFLLLGALTRN